MLAEWPLKTKHKSSLFKTNQRSRVQIEQIFCTGVTEFSHWVIVFWGKKNITFFIWFQNCRFYTFLRLFPHIAQIPTGKSFVLNYILTNSGSCNELGKPLRLERSPVDFLFFRSRSHVFFIAWSLCSLFRDPSPATSIPTGSKTHNIWTIFMAFHHILIRRHAKDALEKIHWSIATRITHLSCWMHSRKTNNLITDWIVVFLSHLELQTGAKFFLNKSFWTRSFENGLQGDLLRGRPSISRC